MGTESVVNTMDSGFENAVAAFAAEDQAPEPVVEGARAPAQEPPKPEDDAPLPEAAAAEQEPVKKPDDFVEFTTPEQKERFNKVFGYAKRLEREMQALQQRLAAPAPAPQPQPVVTPQPTEAKPKLADYETADDWAEAVSDWAARKAEHRAATLARQEFLQQQRTQQMQREQEEVVRYLQSKTSEGYQKYGQMAFDNVCADLAAVAPPGSSMNQALFGLSRFADVVVELGKNLAEADRISRMNHADQIFELKTLERKLIAAEELRNKTQPKIPAKVEAPGTGEDARAPSTGKLLQAAKQSGNLRDFAKVFESDPTL